MKEYEGVSIRVYAAWVLGAELDLDGWVQHWVSIRGYAAWGLEDGTRLLNVSLGTSFNPRLRGMGVGRTSLTMNAQ